MSRGATSPTTVCLRSAWPRRRCATGRRRGYVLLATVAVLVLVVVVLSGMIRSSLARVVLAGQAQEDVQRRWGIISCQRALLPHAEQVLSRQEAAQRKPLPSHQARIQLGTCQITVIVADEQAKFNVNAGLRGRHKVEVEQAIREGLRGSGLSGRVRLMVPDEPNVWPIGSFAHVLPEVPARRLLGLEGSAGSGGSWRGEAPADVLTCWSDGKINLLRASEASLRATLRPAVSDGQITDLLRGRQELLEKKVWAQRSDADTQETREAYEAALDEVRQSLLAAMGADEGAKQRMMAAESRCHSMWVVADDGRTQTYRFVVLDRSEEDGPRKWALEW